MDILKAKAIRVGTEKDAQQQWYKFLKPFGFEINQAFALNDDVGTDRVVGTPERKSTVMHHLFNPKYIAYTYYDNENNIPLYTRTRGVISKDLVVWAGLVGMYDVAGARFPSDNPKKNVIRRKIDGKSTAKEIIRMHRILEREGRPFDGKMPPSNWTDNLSTEQQEDFLEANYPEYHRYLIENLHQPIEATDFLNELNVTKGRAAFLSKVDEMVNQRYPDLRNQIWDDAVELDDKKYQIVIISNPNVRSKVLNRGFKRLTTDYLLDIQENSSTPKSVKSALLKINSEQGKLLGENSEYFIRTPRGESIEPIVKSVWRNNVRGSNMKDSWRDIIKFKGRFDDDEDEKDKQGKEPMPAGNNPPKKPKDKSEKGKIFEDSNPSSWRGDWKRRKGIDPITGKKTNAGEMARETEIVGTDTPCCAEIRQLLKDYMELTAKPNPVNKKNIENWIDANIPCVDIEKAMAFRGPNNWLDAKTDNRANAGIDDKRGFTIPMEFDDEEQELYFPNPKTIRIEAHTPNFFRTVAGKLSFIPEKKWAFKDPDARSPSQKMKNGKGYTLGMHFNDCISGKQKNPMTAANTLDNEDFYADMATTQEQYLVEMKEIIDAFQLRGGKLGRGGQPDVRQMQKEMPDLYQRWQRISQISQTNTFARGSITEDEMNANEKARERLWDYLEEMSGKKIDRDKLRRENPLDDYEYYTGEEEDD